MKHTVSLKQNHEFRRLYNKGKSAVSPYFAVYCRQTRRPYSRLGITTGVKLGKAVKRNFVRRRIRELYRTNEDKLLPGYDIVVVARTRAIYGRYADLERSFLQLMKKLEKRSPHTRRIPILGVALAFALSYIADKYFGVADITGAYCAGVILCSLRESDYIERKVDINSYMIFGPVFFASIGLQTNLRQLDTTILVFSLAFVVVGLVGKIIGCGLMGRACGFNGHDSMKIGVGMMTRGEVALIVAQRGLKAGLMTSSYFTAVILLIIVSSILTPILLKMLYEKYPEAA